MRTSVGLDSDHLSSSSWYSTTMMTTTTLFCRFRVFPRSSVNRGRQRRRRPAFLLVVSRRRVGTTTASVFCPPSPFASQKKNAGDESRQQTGSIIINRSSLAYRLPLVLLNLLLIGTSTIAILLPARSNTLAKPLRRRGRFELYKRLGDD